MAQRLRQVHAALCLIAACLLAAVPKAAAQLQSCGRGEYNDPELAAALLLEVSCKPCQPGWRQDDPSQGFQDRSDHKEGRCTPLPVCGAGTVLMDATRMRSGTCCKPCGQGTYIEKMRYPTTGSSFREPRCSQCSADDRGMLPSFMMGDRDNPMCKDDRMYDPFMCPGYQDSREHAEFKCKAFPRCAKGTALVGASTTHPGSCGRPCGAGQPITNYKSKWCYIWIRNVFSSQHLLNL